jgi:hypothetical protein
MAAGDGLVSMTPTSIAHSGTSAAINADGGVDFTACTSISLNGCFTSDFDNYLIYIGGTSSAGAFTRIRMRTAGSDVTTGTYTIQHININGTSVTSGRDGAQSWLDAMYWQTTAPNNFMLHVYGPNLAQATAIRCVTQDSDSSARMYETAGTHSLATAYDSISFFRSSGSFTGLIHVFGYEE